MRSAARVAVLLIWLGFMATILFKSPAQVEEPNMGETFDLQPAASNERDRWWGIYLEGHKIGYVYQALEQTREGTEFVQRSVLRMTTLGVPQAIRSIAWGSMTQAFELRTARLALVTGASTFEVDISIVDGDLIVRTDPDRQDSATRIPADTPVFLPVGLRAAAFQGPLEIGHMTAGRTFDPLTRTFDALRLEVKGWEPLPRRPDVMTWRVEESWKGVQSVLWVSSNGELLREEGPMGLTAISEPREKAVQLEELHPAWDAIEAVSVPVDVDVVEPRTRDELRVHLTGLAQHSVPVGDGQIFDGETLVVKRADMSETQSYNLPYEGRERVIELQPTLWMQAGHPRIRALARSILGPERDARNATALLLKWVFDYLEKVPSATVPNALETLDRGNGDCNEHAVLFGALARAAGVPTRTVAGTVYAGGRFLYHAWAEVWLGMWVPLDPALGQFPADATHIKLVDGDLEAQMRMMAVIGKLGIEVVDTPID